MGIERDTRIEESLIKVLILSFCTAHPPVRKLLDLPLCRRRRSNRE
jgi:hypothetical protein